MKEFKYDVVQLINGVKDRPCLWDKTLDVYKDRYERRKAWEEIFNFLDEGYESMPAEEKRLTGELILNKWTNIRDTFVKSLRMKMGKPRRKYMLYNHLKFLMKTLNADGTNQYPEEVTYLKEEYDNASGDDVDIVPTKRRSKRAGRSEVSPNTSKTDNKKRSKKKEAIEETASKASEYDESGNDIDFVEVDDSVATTDPRLMNEDEAFFASLLPTVVKYSEDERLEFRIEVLGVMKRLKKTRKWSIEDGHGFHNEKF